MNYHSSTTKKHYLPVIGAALLTASLFRLSLPAFAAGTAAGQELKNKATATYSDGDNNFETISNEVTVTVGKIAGITAEPSGNSSNGEILPGQSVGLDFRVTNTGNDVSSIFIPDVSNIEGYDGTTDNLTVNSVTYRLSSEPDVPGSYKNRSTLTDGIVENIAADDFIIVRVNVTVDNDVLEDGDITVQLGSTGPNDNSVDTQNQPDTGNGESALGEGANDVRTTAPNASGTPAPAVTTAPINGQREASATNTVRTGAIPLALPKITKTGTANSNGTPATLTDDVITYGLGLEVLSSGLAGYTSPNFNYTFKDLEGRDYNPGQSNPPTNLGTITPTSGSQIPIPADQTNLILISDAIPVGTTLNLDASNNPIGVTAPTGWTAIYTQDSLETPADEATWFEDPVNLVNTSTPPVSTVTRIGWVYDARATAPGDGAITKGSPITSGFGFQVQPVDNDVTVVNNIAQVFGSTDDGDNTTTTGSSVFDESGDQNPGNFNDDGEGGPNETIGFSSDGGTTVQYGFADPDDGNNVETTNNGNDGTGPGGEINQVEVTPPVVATSSLLNGPDEAPEAVGELFNPATKDDNHDFQNQSANTPASSTFVDNDFSGNGNVTKTYDPDPVIFTNEVKNVATIGSNPINVKLVPIVPETTGLGAAADNNLPTGTFVKITFGNNSDLYEYNGSTFTLDSNDTNPIVINNLNPNSSQDYTVEVNLPPSGTALSTNFVDPADPSQGIVGGFPIPILAYAGDTAPTTINSAAGNNFNVTTNQIYTGFLKLQKNVTILRRSDLEDPESARTEVADDPIPGDIIKYDVVYTNISESQGNASDGNGLLEVNDLVITEDGTSTVAGGNNWAIDDPDDGDTLIDTLHVEGSAETLDTNDASITTIPIKYVDDAGTSNSTSDTGFAGEIVRYEVGGAQGIDGIQPGDKGTFTFQRKVTEESDIPDSASNP